MAVALRGAAEPSGAEAPFEAAEAVQPVAGTAVGDAVPSGAEASEPFVAAGIAAAAEAPLAADAGTGAAAVESADAGSPEAEVRASGTAAEADRQAVPDGPVLPPGPMERHPLAAEILAEPMAAQGRAGHPDHGHPVRVDPPVPAAGRLPRAQATYSAEADRPAVLPVRLPALAAHCPDEDSRA